MAELWKTVYGYENLYEVSNLGRVRSFSRVCRFRNGYGMRKGKILKPQERQHGYLSVWLYKGETRKQVSIHRLVAEAFCERRDGCDEVNHLNENKQDNRAENLMWCTRQENCSYGERPSTIRRKNTNGKQSKPVRQYTLSGEFVKEYPSMHEAKRQTGISEGGIYYSANHKVSHAGGYVWEYA